MMTGRVVLAAAAAVALLAVASSAATAKYPVDASWFANRWTLADWTKALTEFKEQGGSIVWQRGADFRLRAGGVAEIQNDADWVWCWSLEDCLGAAQRDADKYGVVIKNWYTHANEDEYLDEAMLRCPFDAKINSSRVYYRMIVPHDKYDGEWDCTLRKGQAVDVVMTTFSGIDPHALLLRAADKLDMSVYMPQPAAPWADEHKPAFLEFTKRVMSSWAKKYASLKSYAGVYQTTEAWLGSSAADIERIGEVNKVLSAMIHAIGKLFVISPYIDINNSQQPWTTVADHVTGYKILARSGCDVIAVQEGRGCAKGAYWWSFQKNATVVSTDPMLDKICHYLDPKLKPNPTFEEAFSSSNQVLFKAFEQATDDLLAEEGVKTELWLNLEAFEYLRDTPCLPVDTAGNGMSELIDRTDKARIDWGLTVAGARPTKMISFAWDGDYLCTDGGYAMSLTDEIKADWKRPIVSYFDLAKGDIRGFNIAASGTRFNVACSSGKSGSVVAAASDASYGSKHNRHPLLQQATIKWAECQQDEWVCVTATSSSGLTSYHEFCYEYGVAP